MYLNYHDPVRIERDPCKEKFRMDIRATLNLVGSFFYSIPMTPEQIAEFAIKLNKCNQSELGSLSVDEILENINKIHEKFIFTEPCILKPVKKEPRTITTKTNIFFNKINHIDKSNDIGLRIQHQKGVNKLMSFGYSIPATEEQIIDFVSNVRTERGKIPSFWVLKKWLCGIGKEHVRFGYNDPCKEAFMKLKALHEIKPNFGQLKKINLDHIPLGNQATVQQRRNSTQGCS